MLFILNKEIQKKKKPYLNAKKKDKFKRTSNLPNQILYLFLIKLNNILNYMEFYYFL